MNVSSVYSVPTRIMDKMPSNPKAFKPIQKQIANGDVFLSSSKKSSGFKKLLKGLLVGASTIVATSCLTTRGGNFIYNEMTDEMEDVKKFKKDNNLEDINEGEIITNSYGLYSCYDQDYIRKYGVDKWIKDNEEKLVGSCILDQEDGFVSKGIRCFTNTSHCDKDEVPSHAVSIYKEDDGSIKMLQVNNDPGVHSEDLADYLKNTHKNYILYLRDFDMDTNKFSKCMKSFIGQSYGYISAIQSASSVLNIDGGLHCSEAYFKGIQDQGMMPKADANKITPHTLLHLLSNKHLNDYVKQKDIVEKEM